jgi:hypothetical protein
VSLPTKRLVVGELNDKDDSCCELTDKEVDCEEVELINKEVAVGEFIDKEDLCR